MDFRKELVKELGLGAIAENTMLDDYVKACEAIAIRYHDSEVKKLNLLVIDERSEQLKVFDELYDYAWNLAEYSEQHSKLSEIRERF